MLTKKDVFKKAQEIIKDREEEQQHIDVCMRANICPECGESIKLEAHEKYHNIIVVKCTLCEFNYEIIDDDDCCY